MSIITGPGRQRVLSMKQNFCNNSSKCHCECNETIRKRILTPPGVPLILASASPRRKEILEAHGHRPIVIPAGVDEIIPEGESLTPEETAIYLAELKATALFETLDPEDWPDGCTILGVDTIVYKDRIIGKPKDEADALDILRSLKNTQHEVISGVCIIRAFPPQSAPTAPSPTLTHPEQSTFAASIQQTPPDPSLPGHGPYGPAPSGPAQSGPAPSEPALSIAEKLLFSDTTTVRFGDYTDSEILAYIRANPPYDKSGSYAIQSDWGRHVLEVSGDIENVIGLPYQKLAEYL